LNKANIKRLLVISLPVMYAGIIWFQSSYFNPGFIYSKVLEFPIEVLIFAGVSMELFHLVQFGILYLFIIMAVLSFKELDRRAEYIAVAFSLFYGLLDEIHQTFVPFRSFSYMDLFKDSIGVICISIIVHKCYYSEKKSRIGSFLRKIRNLSYSDKSNVHL
jgi:polysaccharide biosynthesis protein VpsQ